MKIGDRCFVHGYVDEIRKDTVIVRNKGGYFGTDPGEVITVNDTAHPNWIACDEKLPERSVEVLTYTAIVNLIEIQSLEMESDTGVFYWENQHGDIQDVDITTAWMPLPEPYREEGE